MSQDPRIIVQILNRVLNQEKREGVTINMVWINLITREGQTIETAEIAVREGLKTIEMIKTESEKAIYPRPPELGPLQVIEEPKVEEPKVEEPLIDPLTEYQETQVALAAATGVLIRDEPKMPSPMGFQAGWSRRKPKKGKLTREQVIELLETADWNQRGAATLVDMHPANMNKLIRSYQIIPPNGIWPGRGAFKPYPKKTNEEEEDGGGEQGTSGDVRRDRGPVQVPPGGAV